MIDQNSGDVRRASGLSRRGLIGGGLALSAALPSVASAQAAGWTRIPGSAREIGAGDNGTVCVIGRSSAGAGGNTIHRWNTQLTGNVWQTLGGAATDITVQDDGRPWVINQQNGIFRWSDGSWQNIPGRATDIAAGGGAEVYVIGTGAVPGGYRIYRWNGQTSGSAWDVLPGGAVRIAVDQAGNPWVVNDVGYVYRWNGSGWTRLPGAAVDIGAGGGEIYVIGTIEVPGGFSIHRYGGGTSWIRLSGGGTRIDADGNGVPWVVNDVGNIYRAN